MKRLFVMLAVVAVAAFATSCGGGSIVKSKQAEVSLDVLDDYFTVKSYAIESDAKEKGLEKLDAVKGTLTIVVERNKEPMKLKPSDVEYADFGGTISSSIFYVFHGDCDAAVKKLIKMEPGTTETLTLGFKGVDSSKYTDSEEEKQEVLQNIYDALTKRECLDQIKFDIDLTSAAEKALNLTDDDDDDDDDDWDD